MSGSSLDEAKNAIAAREKENKILANRIEELVREMDNKKEDNLKLNTQISNLQQMLEKQKTDYSNVF